MKAVSSEFFLGSIAIKDQSGLRWVWRSLPNMTSGRQLLFKSTMTKSCWIGPFINIMRTSQNVTFLLWSLVFFTLITTVQLCQEHQKTLLVTFYKIPGQCRVHRVSHFECKIIPKNGFYLSHPKHPL